MSIEVTAKTLIEYQTSEEKIPFRVWLKSLDKGTQVIIRARLERLRHGQFGDSKSIKGSAGIYELRIDYGPGYRIYFANAGETIVVLLIGGAKKSQGRDIKLAVKYWADYQQRI